MVNIRNSIEASLGHDLGMIGRDKYKNERETCRMHPIDSARLMRVICPEAGKNVYRAIETHMWPLYSSSPESLEGYILTIADKISAISEFLRADWHCRHIVMMPAYY